ncbi:MAG: M28 family peptidase [Bellilinea sp.]
MKKQSFWLIALVIALGTGLIIGLTLINSEPAQTRPGDFDKQRAYQDIVYQIELGPRTPGSQAHEDVVKYFIGELSEAGWDVEVQETSWGGHPIRNVIAKRGEGPWIILGAHYDSRMAADHDVELGKQSMAVPGANDAASGTAILLELARCLPADLNQEVWLVFFDAEDQGGLPGWDWILGSSAMAADLDIRSGKPEAVVVVDMVADADLNIYMERNSDLELTQQIWASAAELGYEEFFIPKYKHSILDDHTPFLNREIHAVDIIDFDYPYYHTTQDTLDKVSADSLEVVGRTLQRWVMVRAETIK